MNDIAIKVFLSSAMLLLLIVATMKCIGEYKGYWYQNVLTISFIVIAVVWVISGFIVIWTR